MDDACLSSENLAQVACSLVRNEVPDSAVQHALDHAQRCRTCRDTLAENVVILQAVHSIPRNGPGKDCLDDNTLAAFVDHRLSGPDRSQVEEHLASCDYCVSQVAELHDLVQYAGETPLRFVLRLARQGLEWLAHPTEGFTSAPRPAPIMLNEGDTPEVVEWTQTTGGLSLHFRAVPAGTTQMTLAVDVTRETPVPHGRFCLKQNGKLVQAEALSRGGNLLLRGLKQGAYQAEITVDDASPIVFDLVIAPPDDAVGHLY